MPFDKIFDSFQFQEDLSKDSKIFDLTIKTSSGLASNYLYCVTILYCIIPELLKILSARQEIVFKIQKQQQEDRSDG